MTTTLASLGIDPNNSPYKSADILLAGKLTALYEYAKSLEDILKHVDVHSAYERGGYSEMTTEEKETFEAIAKQPWNFEG